MKVLVTGADGFVGGRMVRRLGLAGHQPWAAIRPGTRPPAGSAGVVELELRDPASVAASAATAPDAVVHLAAVSTSQAARRDAGGAWEVNAAGTARLCEALAPGSPVFLLVSTAEVYGPAEGRAARRETDTVTPVSAYAASKLAAEIAALEVGRRAGLKTVIARAFPHVGAGMHRDLAVPAFAARLRDAQARGLRTVPVGNLDAVRDFLHVDDVVEAYLGLLQQGVAGEVYNVASGVPVSLAQVFEKLAALIEVSAQPVADPALLRPNDIPHLVGDATRLRDRTGWRPRHTLDQALAEVVGAQAD